jgi:imidazolonepropionase-like amidohydrolase
LASFQSPLTVAPIALSIAGIATFDKAPLHDLLGETCRLGLRFRFQGRNMTMKPYKAALLAATTLLAQPALAQRPTLSPETLKYVSVDAPVIAITHVRVVDGTGAAPKTGQTLVLDNGLIKAVGPDASTPVPAGAKVIDGTGKTVIPGLIHMHEHLFYTILQGKAYSYNAETFTKLYLAGGVTSLRTGGSMHFAGDMHVRDFINKGLQPGPWMDTTGPYINQEGAVPQLMTIKTPEEAIAAVNFYADQGAMSFKGYMQLTRAELGAAIQAVHKRGLKMTAHLCSVTLREAADLGIDNIEHGLGAASDFKANKEPDKCPNTPSDFSDAKKVTDVLRYLKDHNVAMTSNVALSDTDRETPGLDVLAPNVAAMFMENRKRPQRPAGSPPSEQLTQQIKFDKAFYDMGGGAHDRHRPHRQRRRCSGIFQHPRDRIAHRKRFQVRGGHQGLDHERRHLPQARRQDRLTCARQTGGRGADQRRSHHQTPGHAQYRDRVQGRLRLRSEKADRRCAWKGGALLEASPQPPIVITRFIV